MCLCSMLVKNEEAAEKQNLYPKVFLSFSWTFFFLSTSSIFLTDFLFLIVEGFFPHSSHENAF